AEERFVTTDRRYFPAVGALRPKPTVFIVEDAIELVLQPDLSVLLSDFPVIAATDDYMIFDLTRRLSATRHLRNRRAGGVSALHTEPAGIFYRFPSKWRDLRRGMTPREVLRVLGKPNRTMIRPHLRKRFEAWFYGAHDKYAIVFVDGEMFAKAQSL